ncbi:MAG: Gfo/Idh/MocA family oxidoreductase [Hyphomicrobiales bacterium]
MQEPPLKIGMIGYGYFARFHLNAWQRMEGVELVGLAETATERRKAAQIDASNLTVFQSIDEMLDVQELDLLDVATPSTTHLSLIEPQLGKVPVIVCQKPFCENLSQAEELANLAENSTSKLVVHENFRFQPWYREIARLIDADRLGRVVQAQFRMRPGDGAAPDAYLDRQPYFRNMEKFLIRETGVHWVDVFRFLFGEPVSLSADLFRTNPVIAGEDSGTFTFQMANGARIQFDGNRTLDHPAENRRLTMGEFLVEGRHASLHLSGDGEIKLREFGSNEWHKHTYEFHDVDFGGDCVFHFQRHVRDHLLEGAVLENEATEYLKNLRVQEDIYAAAKDGVRISLLGKGSG